MRALLVIAAVLDAAVAALLIAVSGFIFGGGPESMNAGALAAALYGAAVIACLVAPFIGFMFNRRGKGPLGLTIACLPLAGALIALSLPPPY